MNESQRLSSPSTSWEYNGWRKVGIGVGRYLKTEEDRASVGRLEASSPDTIARGEPFCSSRHKTARKRKGVEKKKIVRKRNERARGRWDFLFF